MSDKTLTTTVQDVTLERIFNAPRELVWQAWTDPEHLKRWWGPEHFTAPVIQLDFRVGGKYLYCMQGPDGTRYWSTGSFKEIVPQERIIYTDSFADDQGNVVPATYYGMGEDFPLETTVRLTFEALADAGGQPQTRMTLIHYAMPGGQDGEMATMGWNQSFDKLAQSLTLTADAGAMPEPAADLKVLDRLVGTWRVTGEAEGQVRFAWLDGGFFLVQHVDLHHGGRHLTGIELIGHMMDFGEDQATPDIRSRYYGNYGESFTYVYELEGDTLTIWGGDKGSPAFYRGTFSADGSIVSGGWEWPGGGYKSDMTRVS